MQSLSAAAGCKSFKAKSICLVRQACRSVSRLEPFRFPCRAGPPTDGLGADYGNTVARPNTAIAPRNQRPGTRCRDEFDSLRRADARRRAVKARADRPLPVVA
jgi:hypothetical protein